MAGTVRLQVQRAAEGADLPGDGDLRVWARAALADAEGSLELALRIVGEDEAGELNLRYRQRAAPTNVLSFPADIDEDLAQRLRDQDSAVPLGDIVICAPLVRREAQEQGKDPRAHWAHLLVHGVLHLCGYDHQTEAEAAEMESREREVLRELGFGDPYSPA